LKVHDLTQQQRVVFYAICKFFKKGAANTDLEKKRLKNWMRFVWNMVSVRNPDGGLTIDSVSSMKSVIGIISSFDTHNIYKELKYYNKTTQEGLYQHYKEIAKNTSLPRILYNVPARTGLNMASDIVIRLSEIDNIVAIKEASGNIVKSQMIVANTKEDFIVFSGNDDITIPMMSIGAKGIISVISNAYPKYVKEMVDSFDKGEVKKAAKMQVNMVALSNMLFVD